MATLPELILNVLLKDSSLFGLTNSEIAQQVYGIGYKRKTKREFTQDIANAMHRTKRLAEEQGITVYAKRKPTKNHPEILSRVECWKIVRDPEDPETKKEYQKHEVDYKTKLKEIAINSETHAISVGRNRGLLPDIDTDLLTDN